MMSHVRIEPTTEFGRPTSTHSGVGVGIPTSGGRGNTFFGALYLDGVALMHAQSDDEVVSALNLSASLPSNCVRLLGHGEAGALPILSPAESTLWGLQLTFLGWDINTHTCRIPLPYDCIERLSETSLKSGPRPDKLPLRKKYSP